MLLYTGGGEGGGEKGEGGRGEERGREGEERERWSFSKC